MTRFFLPRTCFCWCSSNTAGVDRAGLTYAFEQVQQMSPRLVGDVLGIDAGLRRHYILVVED